MIRRSWASSPDVGVATWLSVSACTGIVLACLILRNASPTNTDVSWLLDMGTQWLDGRQPYSDIIEVNPPASILIYMPAVLAARLSGLTPEFVTIVLVIAGALASLVLTGRILRRGSLLTSAAAAPSLFAGLTICLLLPCDTFGQREHIAMLASLPMLASLAVRCRNGELSSTEAVLAGLAGGVTLAIKPMFVLTFAGPVLYLMALMGWRATLVAIEVPVAGAILAVYGAGVLTGAPVFVNVVMPMVLAAYVPCRLDLRDLVLAGTTLIFVSTLIAWLLSGRGRRRTEWENMLVLAAIGFETAFFLQGKGFSYHALPGLMLGFLALASGLSEACGFWTDRLPQAPGIVLGAAMFGLCVLALNQHYDLRQDAPGLEEAIRRTSPNPTMVVLSTDIGVGHPFVRDVGGRWIGSLASDWVTGCVAKLELAPLTPEARAKLDDLVATERTIVAHDISRGRPDVILIDDRAPTRWIDTSPALAQALVPYQKVGQYGPIALLTRRQSADPATAAAISSSAKADPL